MGVVPPCTLTVQRLGWKPAAPGRSLALTGGTADEEPWEASLDERQLQQVMDIIAHAGEGKSLALEALACARRGDYASSEARLAGSAAALAGAHEIHRQVLAESAADQEMPVTFLLVHAADYMMSAAVCRDLIEEMVLMYKELRHV